MFSFHRIREIRNGKDLLSHLVLAPCQTDIVAQGLRAPTTCRRTRDGAAVPALDTDCTSRQFFTQKDSSPGIQPH